MTHDPLSGLLASVANRDSPRSEATLQSDIRQLLLSAPLNLEEGQVVPLEAPAPGRRRIDIEVGFTVIEVKKDLRVGNVLQEAVTQLTQYVQSRTATLDQRYVGILTDGADWRAYHLGERNELEQVSSFSVARTKVDLDAFLIWLEGVLATTQGVIPTPLEISRRLGADSSAHALDRASLETLYRQHSEEPSVQIKRQLWAKLLRTALGTQFEDSDDLFLEHTLLVNSAEAIAHAVLGFSILTLPPRTLLGGQRFTRARITGVVEEDFFDWVIDVSGGEPFIRGLARRLARFDWSAVEHDILKVLYESVIGTDTRKRLGEYYTPDWLAERMVQELVADPLGQRVLDPACGSGTFLLHAVRRFLETAEQAGLPLRDALGRLTDQVLGLDLHPVAVALARVTYLLAIGRDRLRNPTRGPINVPVYLGDSIQWDQQHDLYTAGHLVIRTTDNAEYFASELRFPDRLLADAARFNGLVAELADLASGSRRPGSVPSLVALFRRLAIPEEDQTVITRTFAVMCRLHDEGRDHIWGYYVRNLARPLWLSRPENRVDVLIGNPPWLAYRHMPRHMQVRFREMSSSRELWHGQSVATHQDLSGLFVARTIQLYLRPGGQFAYVMPSAALDRGQFKGFRTGNYPDIFESTTVAFKRPWDLRRIRPHFFPRAAAVVSGERTTDKTVYPLPETVEIWTGRLPKSSQTWKAVDPAIVRLSGSLIASDDTGGRDDTALSPYSTRFAEGATITPRMLFIVEEEPASPLGLPAEMRAVRSARSVYENSPWKHLERHEGVVEEEFVYSVYLGAAVLPFRVMSPGQAVIPLEGTNLLNGASDRIDLYPGLANWWREAEHIWMTHRSSDRLTLIDRLNFQNGLSDQVPPPTNRVLYGKSGMHLVAARIDDPIALIDHTLYWGATATTAEALYLCAILNSPRTLELVRPLMSYGKDERHIDKHIWQLPIPLFDPANSIHVELSKLGLEAESIVSDITLETSIHFSALRRRIRQHIASSPVGPQIDAIVDELIKVK